MKNMDYEVPYYATFSFVPLLAVMSKYFLFHHSFTLPLYMNKETFLTHVNSHVCTTDYASHHILYNLKFCLTAHFKQMSHMVKECISEWLKYY
jgi:hypothetical protein